MNGVQGLVEQLTSALGIAVMHSLWQCTVIGTLAALIMLAVRRANTRYIVWCVSMLLCAVWVVLTFVGAMWPGASANGWAEVGIDRVLPFAMTPASPEASTMLFEIIAWLWAGGFVFLTLRFMHQWGAARRLRSQGIVAVGQPWLDLFHEIRTGLGVSRRVGLLVSTRVQSPMVVGWLSPVVIVPMSAMMMLSPEQLRLVLVHELAHIRRFDHVVNMLQVLIETVLFYHPVVWWMSHQARLEREHCCDDAAVRWAGNAVEFARALTELETTRTQSRAVLALNQGGSLMNRITRILGVSDRRRHGGRSLRTLSALTAGALVAAAGIANAALRVEEPRHDQIEVVRTNVESGVMTTDQARRIFEEVIFPGSDLQLKLDAELDQVAIKIDTAVSEGRISAEEGQAKLDVYHAAMEDRLESHFRYRVLGMSKSEVRLSMLAESLAKLVGTGEMSQEDAEAKYSKVEREIGVQAQVWGYLAHLKHEIHTAVEAGVLTPEEGREKMHAAMQEGELKLKQAEAEHRIKLQVLSGTLSEEEGELQLVELVRERGESEQGEFVKVYLTQVDTGEVTKIETAIESDKSTNKEGGVMLRQLEIKVEPSPESVKLTPMDD